MLIANPLNLPHPEKPSERMGWKNLSGASQGLAIASLISEVNRPVIILTEDTVTAARIESEIQFFQECPILHFPDWETLPYDHFSPHQDIVSSRLSALYQLSSLKKGVLITTINTLLHRLSPPSFLQGNVFILKRRDVFDIDSTRKKLENAGYRCVPQVREHGEFAVRGSIFDIFPSGNENPFRIDLFDNEIETIRTFSPDTQRSLENVEKIELLPAKEFPLTEESIELFRQQWRNQFSGNPLNCPMYQDISEGICAPGIEYYLPFFFEKTATLFDYLPDNALIVHVGNTHKKSEEFWQDVRARYEQRSHDITHPVLTPQQIFIPTDEIFQKVKQHPQIFIDETLRDDRFAVSSGRTANKNQEYDFATKNPAVLSVEHKAAQPLQALENWIQTYDGRILFCAETTGRREVLLQLFNSISLHPKLFNSWQEFLNSSEKLGITVAPLEDGLVIEQPDIALIAESQLFGKRVMQRRRRKTTQQDTDAIVKDLTELQIGSPIVHIDHGVGRYLGLQTLKVAEQLTEFLAIEYEDNAKLYVPVSSLHLISRYSGMDPEHAPLNRLGTEQWSRAKRKAAEQVRDVAAELLELYAKRAALPGHVYTELDGQYSAFAAAFPFEETPDQQQAIEQIIADMASDKPMDRLVCGDVGFGKTEVAMRAAFIAAQNNKQVAVLVPTTLLAEQHTHTFLDRFADWPFRIESLSRFKTAKQAQKIIENIAEGKVDIVIGTHKLLQEDIQFKSLGLLIIDEEHRFGVRQKEKLKTLRSSVDILNLTATPIPRTLNMAFSGIRDLSIIATPPAKRLSIKTFVHEFETGLIKEAVMREIMRGGQVYFLHNDVATIDKMTRDLQAQIPEARVAFAHGQMHERELEQIMSDFYHRRFNLLVCTTIIESGIDIPSANTIIINRADKFGLAQLHQLRGRVGRSHHQAYAYLLVNSLKNLTADAEKRLDAIVSLEDLGVGFTLATHDLEIRGAGELLGEGQSGNMQAIGFTLYMDLLSRAVDSLKSGKEPELDVSAAHGTEIDLQIPALIPEKYLGDVHLRLQCYKRIASAKTSAELDDIQVEMIDRFGLLPDSAKNLFYLSELKQKVEPFGIVKIEANAKGGKIEFSDKPQVDPMRIIKLIQTQPKKFKMEGPTRLRFTLDPHEVKDRVNLVKRVLQDLLPP
jgi:transcription-repair coupling factor (superfamily II helicase)